MEQVPAMVVSGDSAIAEKRETAANPTPSPVLLTDLLADWLRLAAMYDEAMNDVRERQRQVAEARIKAQGLERRIRLLLEARE